MLVLHASPHPDDELIAAPATLMALRDAGHEIVNVACSTRSPERCAELEKACERAGFELVLLDGERPLADDLGALCEERSPGLVVGPSPHDRHPWHEAVAHVLLDLAPERLWLWGLWGELPFPTTVVEYGEDRLAEILHALEAHESQLARNDFRRLVAGRGSAATVLAAELVFGFGAAGLPGPYAEATTEVVRDGSGWRLGAARRLDADDPFPEPTGIDVGWWLRARTAADGLAHASG
jgi:LmbE family N-acetylglucosaminyl deacetylase